MIHLNNTTGCDAFKKLRFWILVTVIYIMFFSEVSVTCQAVAILIGSALGILSLLCAYLYGLGGLLATTISGLWGSIHGFVVWLIDGDTYALASAAFAGCILISSVFISLLAERSRKDRARMAWLSTHDGLTGLYNSRYFQDRLSEEVQRAEKSGGCVSLCIIDIDHFKSFNDLNGHNTGDEILKATADVISGSIRKTDIACRYGGDEFTIIFSQTDEDGMFSAVENLQRNYTLMDERRRVKITLSIGCSTYPSPAGNRDALFGQADQALYMAKDSGRNTHKMYCAADADAASNSRLAGSHADSMKALLWLISEKDDYTYGHSERTADYAVKIGRALKLSEDQLKLLEIEGFLHDLGKIEVPRRILDKKEPLTEQELETIRKHPEYSAMIIDSMPDLKNIVEDVRHHHERYDGKGYPDMLKGEAIPLCSRILSVADAFDAMLSDKPYKEKMNYEQALQELAANAGSQFDPQIVKLFLPIMKQ